MLIRNFPKYARRTTGVALATMVLLCAPSVRAQTPTDPAALDQIASLLREKEARSPEQKKISSQLWYALQAERGRAPMALNQLYRSASDSLRRDDVGNARVKITGQVSAGLISDITRLGGTVAHAGKGTVQASVP
ncbi:MAG: hypothetical protein EON87_17585, partial [Brevundimonas sp.]